MFTSHCSLEFGELEGWRLSAPILIEFPLVNDSLPVLATNVLLLSNYANSQGHLYSFCTNLL